MDARERRNLRRLLDAIVDGAAARHMPLRRRDAARRVQAGSQAWLKQPSVQGIGIGEKLTAGKRTGVSGLRVYVDKKKPRAQLDDAAPDRLALEDGEEFPVDVIPIGTLRLHESPYRTRPIAAGVSVANTSRNPGSLGLLVRSVTEPQTPFLLSAYHVLAPRPDSSSVTVTQPAPDDGGNQPADVVAEFTSAMPIAFDQDGFPNEADAAIARILPGIAVDRSIPYIGIPVDYTAMLRRGQRVRMFGRTSGYQVGKIRDPDFKMTLDYPAHGGGIHTAGFRNQVLCERYGDSGDSGSAILNTNDHVIGLHIAGSDQASVFSRITPIMRQLNLEIW